MAAVAVAPEPESSLESIPARCSVCMLENEVVADVDPKSEAEGTEEDEDEDEDLELDVIAPSWGVSISKGPCDESLLCKRGRLS